MTPLADAMRFVDGQRRDIPTHDARKKVRHQQSFGRNEQNLGASIFKTSQPAPRLAIIKRRVDRRCRYTRGLQLIDLILHQRNERRHHHRKPVAHQRRQLVAQALARARRQNGHRVAPGERCLHDLALQRPEFVVAEHLLEQCGKPRGLGVVVDRWRHDSHDESGRGSCDESWHVSRQRVRRHARDSDREIILVQRCDALPQQSTR